MMLLYCCLLFLPLLIHGQEFVLPGQQSFNLGEALGIKSDDEEGIFTRNGFEASPRVGQACTDPRGKLGTCSYIYEAPCSNVLRAIKQLGVTPDVRTFLLKAIESPCGYESFDYTLCCVDTSTTPPTTPRPVFTPGPGNLECGISDQLRIVNGQESDPGAWPWAAILGVPSNTNGIAVMCGGTLIKPNYVLTAAHCFDGSRKPSMVRLGDLDISTTSDVAHEDFTVARSVVHSGYSKTTLKNDIALVQLSRPVSYSRGILPACLPDKYRGFPLETLNSEPTIIGWGSTGTGLSTVAKLRQTTVPVEAVSSCAQKYSTVKNINIGSTQICAGTGIKDTCSGDSGGPMLSAELDGFSKWSVIGITSFGVKCADERFPGVYTRVDQYLDWIQSNAT